MACLRLLILLSLALAGLLFAESAAAQTYRCTSSSPRVCDQGEAYAEAWSYARKTATENAPGYGIPCVYATQGGFVGAAYGGSCSGNRVGTQTFYYEGLCSARLDGDAGMINGTLYTGGVCKDGCKMVPNLDPQTDFTLREQSGSAISIRRGTWKASGDVCDSDLPPQPPKKDEFCHQTSSGHTVCKSKDKTCVSTGSGFRTCASDTGNTTGHTATNNSRTEGIGIGAPNTAPNPPSNRPGENWQSSGGGSSITNNATNNITNNNTYNNTGTPNGNQPVPGDGSGPGAGGSNGGAEGGGSDGGEGEGGTGASGGGDCQTPPVVTGDAALAMVAVQTWATRCAVEKNGGGKVVGDINNCEGPFSVEGDSPEAHQLRARRAEMCNGPNWAKPGSGQGNNGDPHDGAEDKDGPGKWTWEFDSDVIDSSGFSSGSCPQLGTLDFGRFGQFSMDGFSGWCTLIAALHAVTLLMGAFISMRIVFGDGS